MFVFVGQICFRFGLRYAFAADDVTLITIVLVFSVISWFVLKRWGPFREARENEVASNVIG